MEALVNEGQSVAEQTAVGARREFPGDVTHEGNQVKRRKLPSSIQLRENLEHIVSEINAKRKRDSDLFDEMKKQFELHVNTTINKIEESLFGRYNKTNKEVEEKIQEFMGVLSRIEKHESDLQDFKRILGVLNEDVSSCVNSHED